MLWDMILPFGAILFNEIVSFGAMLCDTIQFDMMPFGAILFD